MKKYNCGQKKTNMNTFVCIGKAPGPRHFFEKFELVEKESKKKVDNGRPRWSLASVAPKDRKHFHNGRNTEGGGGGRALRVFNSSFLHSPNAFGCVALLRKRHPDPCPNEL